MASLLLGSVGFVVGYLAELVWSGRPFRLRPGLWGLSFGLITSALAIASLDSPRFWVPGWANLAGWLFLPLCAFLLAYSLFIDLPLRTYGASGAADTPVVTGTYALVRHPAVLWFLLLLGALLLASRSKLLLAAAPWWAALDILWPILQERAWLSRARSGYLRYQETTPFLVPTLASLAACLRSIGAAYRSAALKKAGDVHRN